MLEVSTSRIPQHVMASASGLSWYNLSAKAALQSGSRTSNDSGPFIAIAATFPRHQQEFPRKQKNQRPYSIVLPKNTSFGFLWYFLKVWTAIHMLSTQLEQNLKTLRRLHRPSLPRLPKQQYHWRHQRHPRQPRPVIDKGHRCQGQTQVAETL
jgi:hypothetical protein